MNKLINALRCYGKVVPMKCPNMNCMYNVIGTCERERMARDAADAIERLQAQVARWIPVTERLPENDDDVLTFSKYELFPGGDIDVMCYYPRAQRWESDSNVTHWMPLPQPPEV